MKYRVAEFVVDTARYRVSAGEVAVPVEPKVFDLLVHLIRHRDRVLSATRRLGRAHPAPFGCSSREVVQILRSQ